MKTNPWLKLAEISLVGMIVSFLILMGIQQYNQNHYHTMLMNGYQVNVPYVKGYQMNGFGYVPVFQNWQGGWGFIDISDVPYRNINGTAYTKGL